MTCTLCDLETPDPPVTDPEVDGEFCCRGCLEISRTLGDVDPEALDQPATDSAVPDDAETAFLTVDGMHCSACESFVAGTATDHDGVYAAEASYATEMLKVQYDPDRIGTDDLPDLVRRMGYRAAIPEVGTQASERERFGRDELRTVLGALGLMVVMTLYTFFIYPVHLGIYPESFHTTTGARMMVFFPLPIVSTLILGLVGYPIFRGAYVSLVSGRPNMDVLVAGGALAAWGYSMAVVLGGGTEVYFDVSTALVAVVTIGDFVETRVKRRALGRLGELDFGRISEVDIREDGETVTRAIEAVSPGDHVVVKRGHRIPVDGTIVEGEAAVDESLLTGESDPRPVAPGDDVVGGTVPVDGRLIVAVGPDATSTYDRVLGELWSLQSGETRAQRLADTVAAVFVPFVIGLAVLAAIGWIGTTGSIARGIVVGVSVLVVSCPCAFGLATPLAVAAGVDRAASDGVVVTQAAALESLPTIDVLALDKTGTLTTGEMAVDRVESADPARVLRVAAAIEREADHPIADAIVAAATDREIDLADTDIAEFAELPRGATATVDGRSVRLGHPDLFDGWDVPDRWAAAIDRARADGLVVTAVGIDGRVEGLIAVGDRPREGWADALDALDVERRIVVLTGDDQGSIEPFASHPAVDDVFTGVLPEAKAETVRRLRSAHGSVAVVGDGTNDAPALAAADLGVAFASGTELASEAADATVLEGGLDAVARLFVHARTVRSRVRSNIGWALSYNAVTLPAAVAGLINPLIAAVAMAASSLVVVANSARD
ncbi:heavy metal translocating P-type ATPase [Halococcoides cellulosivorans]|uniref:Copper-transporting ATPase n=1 Tax=Halococcoides cellulosivorans TaxID=1679096 RepID=A0A2R4X0Z4_9EURY|nr:cation-translocating P-type ATPase [Halococcoides cellulosivorans]AWB27467.1 copper-transporting ATPase [Halococcoides cellulosivorans]